MNSNLSIGPSFNGTLKIKNARKMTKELLDGISHSPELQNIAKAHEKDIYVGASRKISKKKDIAHLKGTPLYRVYLYTEDKSLHGRIKHLLGLDRIYISRRHHVDYTVTDTILPSIKPNLI